MGKKKNTVLVGIVSRSEDLDIIRHKQWYRIPQAAMPVRPFKYIAFYQTIAIKDAPSRIQYYALVKSQTVVPRIKLLPDEPEHPRAHDMYVQLQLGRIKELKRPIINTSHMRISFGYTTLAKLEHGKAIHQLFGNRALELLMGQLLKRSRIDAQREYQIMYKNRCKYRLDFAVFCRSGKIDIECDSEEYHNQPARKAKDQKRDTYMRKHGWTIIRLSGKAITHSPAECIQRIRADINLLGGLESVYGVSEGSAHVRETVTNYEYCPFIID